MVSDVLLGQQVKLQYQFREFQGDSRQGFYKFSFQAFGYLLSVFHASGFGLAASVLPGIFDGVIVDGDGEIICWLNTQTLEQNSCDDGQIRNIQNVSTGRGSTLCHQTDGGNRRSQDAETPGVDRVRFGCYCGIL